RCAGRVEVKHQGQCGTVYDDSWDMEDAAVVCKQLGCRSALELAQFGPGSGPIWMDGVGCDGTESALSDCRHIGWGQHYCDHIEDAGVTCSGTVQACSSRLKANCPFDLSSSSQERNTSLPPIMLLCPQSSQGSDWSVCDGRVEVQVLGTWGTLSTSHWDLFDTHVLCRQLNCG
ncbi:DMBT1 protein, partial [Crotophaga sulcirostris]|nr:DMBT1 protein [Crotophaga sulcirostris]